MNRDCPKIISDETLHKRVFKYDTSAFDNRFFRQRIVDYLNSDQTKSFSQFMWEAVWERNDGGKTLKYCDFNERHQKCYLDPYFYEWMTRTIRKADTELSLLNADQQPTP